MRQLPLLVIKEVKSKPLASLVELAQIPLTPRLYKRSTDEQAAFRTWIISQQISYGSNVVKIPDTCECRRRSLTACSSTIFMPPNEIWSRMTAAIITVQSCPIRQLLKSIEPIGGQVSPFIPIVVCMQTKHCARIRVSWTSHHHVLLHQILLPTEATLSLSQHDFKFQSFLGQGQQKTQVTKRGSIPFNLCKRTLTHLNA